MIDWTRVAEPQADQYDTLAALYFAHTRTRPKRPAPYHRRPVGEAPTIFDGEVAVRRVAETCPGYPKLDHGPSKHPNIDLAVESVKRWPDAYQQFKMLMDSFHPMIYKPGDGDRLGEVGSFSHADDDKFGTMYATVFDAKGLAQAFVHEMAHNKMRAMGIFTEDTAGFITNPPDQLFESPRCRRLSAST